MATITIFKRRIVRSLSGIQKLWVEGKRWRHAQASGFFIGKLATDSRITADHYLPMITRFIDTNGPWGLDGILLSAMSTAQRLNHQAFGEALGICDIYEGMDPNSKDGLGIYFADLSALPGTMPHLPGGGVGAGQIGSMTGGILSGGEFNSLLVNGFPDSFRDSLSNGGVIGSSSRNPLGMGVDIRKGGRLSIEGQDSAGEKQELYGMTRSACVETIEIVYEAAGALIGVAVGLAPTTGIGPVSGMSTGGYIGVWFGKIWGTFVCGIEYGSDDDNTGTAEAAEVTTAEVSEDESDDTDPDEAGICIDPDDESKTPCPDVDAGGNMDNPGARAFVAFTELMRSRQQERFRRLGVDSITQPGAEDMGNGTFRVVLPVGFPVDPRVVYPLPDGGIYISPTPGRWGRQEGWTEIHRFLNR